jgi:hypothetical protein
MNTRKATIRDGINGQMVSAELLLCPECDNDTFILYSPEGVNHLHLQCVVCATSFCDGCKPGDPGAPDRPMKGAEPTT